MAKRVVQIEIDDVIEIHNAAEFAKWAGLFGVDVSDRGRKPKSALAVAIRDYAGEDLPTTIVDTDYFSADMADGDKGGSEYGVKLAALRVERDAAIQAAHDEFDRARDALRAEYGHSPVKATAKGNAYKVTAQTPMLDKDTGAVMRTKSEGDKPGKVKFLPSTRSVTLTVEQIRALTNTVGARGRVSQSDTLKAAVLAGEWLPVDLMATDGWHTVLLRNAVVEPVTVEPASA
jgi:hypothetical protein